MYFIIVGAGIAGVSLAKWLVSAGHEVAVIDRSEARCIAVDDELGSISVLGDGTELGVLTKAGIKRADTVIATTGADDTNLVACQVAHHIFDIQRTVSIVNVPERERLFRILGVNILVNATDLIVNRFQREMGELLIEEIEEEVRNLE